MSAYPCSEFTPDPTLYTRQGGIEQAKWIRQVFKLLYGESCATNCVSAPNANQGSGSCRGTNVSDACLGCMQQNACTARVLKCATALESKPNTLRNTELAVLGTTNQPDPNAGLTPPQIIGIWVGSTVAVLAVIGVIIWAIVKKVYRGGGTNNFIY